MNNERRARQREDHRVHALAAMVFWGGLVLAAVALRLPAN